jgi:renalase
VSGRPAGSDAVCVVGAGLAGLRCARALHDAGREVVVLEKGRGPGGRTASRRTDRGRFDHGVPALPAGTLPEGIAAAWTPRTAPGEPALDGLEVAVPTMHAHARALAEGLDVRTQATVAGLRTDADGAHAQLEGGEELGPFARVVVTAPGPQAAALLRTAAPALAARAADVHYDPCWTALAAWEAPLELGFDAAREAGDVAWAVREASKPGREPGERWTVQASAAWSTPRLEAERDAIAPDVVALLAALAGRSELPPPAQLAAHRWRYATPRRRIGEEHLREGRFLLAGDWLAHAPGRVPAASALASGAAAAALLA